ncbi:MAG TPA: hypothetical protein VFE05_08405 [Longimicrobiaceae bacterium]|jgi:hypothetical protein|nr:hypothetical protein [Longimicrobiaceae bacterium]
MNILPRIPRGLSLRRMALMLMLGLALLAPVQAFALIVVRTVTIHYFLGIEIYRTETVTIIGNS